MCHKCYKRSHLAAHCPHCAHTVAQEDIEEELKDETVYPVIGDTAAGSDHGEDERRSP